MSESYPKNKDYESWIGTLPETGDDLDRQYEAMLRRKAERASKNAPKYISYTIVEDDGSETYVDERIDAPKDIRIDGISI